MERAISVRLDDDAQHALRVLTKSGRSQSEAVREALIALARSRRRADLARVRRVVSVLRRREPGPGRNPAVGRPAVRAPAGAGAPAGIAQGLPPARCTSSSACSQHTAPVAAVAAHLGMKCVTVQENWVNWFDSVYDRVGNIQLSRIKGADVRLVNEGFGIEFDSTCFSTMKERICRTPGR